MEYRTRPASFAKAIDKPIAGAALALSVAVASCAGGSGPTDAYKRLTTVDYGEPYIGMTKQEVISCAGPPHSRFNSGAATETLNYRYNGAGPVPGGGQKSGDKGDKKEKKKSSGMLGSLKKSDGDWTCSASLVFENDRLVRVSYAHKDVRSPYAWQSEDDPKKAEEMRQQDVPSCQFSLPRCHR
ncbi:MAG: hypothetical protein ACREDO_03825 [Methyloceanibacter sp.]